MARSILSGLILILLPLALLSGKNNIFFFLILINYLIKKYLGTIFRFTVISFIYGLLLLILPWLGTINERNIRSKTIKIVQFLKSEIFYFQLGFVH
jgi:hypothetical protein